MEEQNFGGKGESQGGVPSAWSGRQVVRRCDVLCRRCVCLAVPRRLWRPVGVRWVFDSCGAVTGVRCPAACLSALCVCENVSVSWWLVRHRYMSRRIVRVAVRTLCPVSLLPVPCAVHPVPRSSLSRVQRARVCPRTPVRQSPPAPPRAGTCAGSQERIKATRVKTHAVTGRVRRSVLRR